MKNEQYYNLIENLVKNHRKYHGLEDFLSEITEDVYEQAQSVIESATDKNVIEKYLTKLVSVTILTFAKQVQAGTYHNTNTNNASIANFTDTETEILTEPQSISDEEIVSEVKLEIEPENTTDEETGAEIECEAETEIENLTEEDLNNYFNAQPENAIEQSVATLEENAVTEAVQAEESTKNNEVVQQISELENTITQDIQPNQELVEKMINGNIDEKIESIKELIEQADSDFDLNDIDNIELAQDEDETVQDIPADMADIEEAQTFSTDTFAESDSTENIEINKDEPQNNIEETLPFDLNEAESIDLSEAETVTPIKNTEKIVSEEQENNIDDFVELEEFSEQPKEEAKTEVTTEIITETEDSFTEEIEPIELNQVSENISKNTIDSETTIEQNKQDTTIQDEFISEIFSDEPVELTEDVTETLELNADNDNFIPLDTNIDETTDLFSDTLSVSEENILQPDPLKEVFELSKENEEEEEKFEAQEEIVEERTEPEESFVAQEKVTEEITQQQNNTEQNALEYIQEQLEKLNTEYPDLFINDIFKYRYVLKYSVLETSVKLNIDKNTVIKALNKIISVVED